MVVVIWECLTGPLSINAAVPPQSGQNKCFRIVNFGNSENFLHFPRGNNWFLAVFWGQTTNPNGCGDLRRPQFLPAVKYCCFFTNVVKINVLEVEALVIWSTSSIFPLKKKTGLQLFFWCHYRNSIDFGHFGMTHCPPADQYCCSYIEWVKQMF